MQKVGAVRRLSQNKRDLVLGAGNVRERLGDERRVAVTLKDAGIKIGRDLFGGAKMICYVERLCIDLLCHSCLAPRCLSMRRCFTCPA